MTHIVRATDEAEARWIERVAKAMYEADLEFAPMETQSWEEACEVGFDAGYRRLAREALHSVD